MTLRTNECEQMSQVAHLPENEMKPTVEYAPSWGLKWFRNGVHCGNSLPFLHIWWGKPTSFAFTFSFWPSCWAHLHKCTNFQPTKYLNSCLSFYSVTISNLSLLLYLLFPTYFFSFQSTHTKVVCTSNTRVLFSLNA